MQNVKKKRPLNSGSKIASDHITKSMKHETHTLFYGNYHCTAFIYHSGFGTWQRTQVSQAANSNPLFGASQVLPSPYQVCYPSAGCLLQKAPLSGPILLQAISATPRLHRASLWRLSPLQITLLSKDITQATPYRVAFLLISGNGNDLYFNNYKNIQTKSYISIYIYETHSSYRSTS